jgi:hypothetical protein
LNNTHTHREREGYKKIKCEGFILPRVSDDVGVDVVVV